MAGGEPPLDPPLTLPEPVQRGVQLVLVGALDAELRGQRRLAQKPRRLELRAGAITRWQIIARQRSRSRDGDRSSSRAAEPASAASTAATCPCGKERSIETPPTTPPVATQPGPHQPTSSFRCEMLLP